jgi:hypothetical protein
LSLVSWCGIGDIVLDPSCSLSGGHRGDHLLTLHQVPDPRRGE